MFQLAQRTWPLTLAALAALIADVAMLRFDFFTRDVDGLALAYAASLGVGFLAAAIPACVGPASRPALRDLLVIAGATLAMTLAIRPLNGIASPVVVAALACAVGGAIFARCDADLRRCGAADRRRVAAARARSGFAPFARPNS